MTREPESTVRAYRWRWAEVRPMFDRIGELVPLELGGERRTLRLANPGLPYGTTHTLWGALQLIYPGEVATVMAEAPVVGAVFTAGSSPLQLGLRTCGLRWCA